MDMIIKEDETIREMKKKLMFLRTYAASLRLYSNFEETPHGLQVEDGLMEYLHYSRSIVQSNGKKGGYSSYDPVLEAMMKQEAHSQQRARKDQLAYLLMQGIRQLPSPLDQLLQDLYIKDLDKALILHHQGDIVESTMNRRVRKALLQLALILQMEILQ